MRVCIPTSKIKRLDKNARELPRISGCVKNGCRTREGIAIRTRQGITLPIEIGIILTLL